MFLYVVLCILKIWFSGLIILLGYVLFILKLTLIRWIPLFRVFALTCMYYLLSSLINSISSSYPKFLKVYRFLIINITFKEWIFIWRWIIIQWKSLHFRRFFNLYWNMVTFAMDSDKLFKILPDNSIADLVWTRIILCT